MTALTFYAAGTDAESARDFARKQFLDWSCSQQIGDRLMVDDELIAEVTAQPASVAVYAAIDAALVGAEPHAGFIRLRGIVEDDGAVTVAVINPDDAWM